MSVSPKCSDKNMSSSASETTQENKDEMKNDETLFTPRLIAGRHTGSLDECTQAHALPTLPPYAQTYRKQVL